MSRPRLFLLLFFLAVNILLLTIYLNQRAAIRHLFEIVLEEPSVQFYQYGSENASRGLLQSPLVNDTYRALGAQSVGLSNMLELLEPRLPMDDPLLFFDRQNPIQSTFQDSLWNMVENYRKLAGQAAEQATPRRRAVYKRYLLVVQIRNEVTGGASPESLRKYKPQLDSIVGWHYQWPVENLEHLDDLIYQLHSLSNAADEVNLNNKLLAMQNLFPSPGAANLYGKTYSLTNLTHAQRHQLFRRAIQVKYELDHLIHKFIYG